MLNARPLLFIHGMCQGGWCWSRMRPFIEDAGAKFYAPTLTGLGERSHLLHPGVGLDTHIADIVNLIIWEDLNDVFLVGHSYGGRVATGVADALPDRIGHALFLDSKILAMDPAQDHNDPPPRAMAEIEVGRLRTPCFAVPDREPLWGISNKEDLAWVRRFATPHPKKSALDRLELRDPTLSSIKKSYVACVGDPKDGRQPDKSAWAFTRNNPDYAYFEMETGHGAMVTEPRKLADLLLGVATE